MAKSKDNVRSALVTGASRGIGFEIARRLTETHNVIIGARDLTKAEKAAKKISSRKVTAIELDVTKESSIRKAAKDIDEKFGRLDVLVNNAAILIDASDLPGETDIDLAKKTLDTNLFGAWRLSKIFIPIMRRNNYGRIVNVSSGAGTIASISKDLYSPSYSLSKASLNMLTLMFARETFKTNVLVNAVDPGWVRTDMGGPNAPRSVEEGADTAVWLANLPDGGPTGKLFRDRKAIDW